MDGFSWVWLAGAALAAGALNALAGGGSFLTFPALVFTGVPPIVANATSALAVSPGYFGSTLGFRRELQTLPARRLRLEAGIAATGGVLGALLLLVTPPQAFRALVPWLLLLATAIFILGPTLTRRLGHGAQNRPRLRVWGLLAVSIYGGYFNGGLGILLMALYAATGEDDVHRANALKNLNSLVLSVLSVLTFALAGTIAWGPAALMAVAATLGGYLGARGARRLPAAAVRAAVIATGLTMTAVFMFRA
ncbi:Sulfite exporter TauE/SafE [Tepidimonas alkaliphilus]|uniref:Probable membrane transporter protein n=1 Tax=Tepidimonas alkaliphilus TaxID=2588942 RepID=A0A554WBS0_9BURK|nr:sulfite exporter TauE/SafE family protein [Tepidimonas alkaliphilus]TSE21019.1 Sulfite exporter TauE/SafE [Tepidimonas alkaliphilus]